jgi:hypothetical protein
MWGGNREILRGITFVNNISFRTGISGKRTRRWRGQPTNFFLLDLYRYHNKDLGLGA